jgi:hypothetical protein
MVAKQKFSPLVSLRTTRQYQHCSITDHTIVRSEIRAHTSKIITLQPIDGCYLKFLPNLTISKRLVSFGLSYISTTAKLQHPFKNGTPICGVFAHLKAMGCAVN